MSDPLQSPTQSFPQVTFSGSDRDLVAPLTRTASTPAMSQVSTPAQPAPTSLRGGFEFDDDGDAQDSTLEEAQDDDVYGASIVADSAEGGDAAETVNHSDQGLIDSSSKSPLQENGVIPIPAQVTGSPANLPDSVTCNNALSQSQSQLPTNGISSQSHPSADLSSALPNSRLAHDVVGILEDRIKDDPRGDIAAWLDLIEELKSRNRDDQVRKTYERYLEVFPLAVSPHSSATTCEFH